MTRSPSWLSVLWLTAVWVGLWGSVSAANVLGGLAVAVVLVRLLPVPREPDRAVVRVVPLLRFAARFAVDLVVSSGQVVVLAVRPRTRLRSAVVAVRVRAASDTLLTVLADAISLTPGTLTIEVDRRRSTLYVHVLDVGGGPDAVDRVRRSVEEQGRRVVEALGSRDARTALSVDLPPSSRSRR